MRPLFRIFLPCLCCLSLAAASLPSTALAADQPQDQRKQTKLGKYVTAVEAFEMWSAAPAKVSVVDVRTPEEYDFLGHPTMAMSVPSMLWTGKFDAQKKAYPLAENHAFVELMKQRFKPTDTLLLICRSGQRSATAANKLIDAGFTNVYSIVDGYEGEKIADKTSPNFGKRLHDGWRNSKNPWTQDLDEKLAYIPQ